MSSIPLFILLFKGLHLFEPDFFNSKIPLELTFKYGQNLRITLKKYIFNFHLKHFLQNRITFPLTHFFYSLIYITI